VSPSNEVVNPGSGPNVLYIGGWGRSGSTLADLLAGRLDGFVSVGEVRELFFRGVIEDRRCGCGETFHACDFWTDVGSVAFGGWDRDVAERMWADLRTVDRGWTTPLLLTGRGSRGFCAARDRVIPVVRRLYGTIAKVAEASVIVDSSKLPNYAALLEAAGLDLRVAHLVRDPRGVMHSWNKQIARADTGGSNDGPMRDSPDDMLRYSSLAGSLRYVGYNALTQLLPRRRFHYERIRYEDLVTSPNATLARLAELAGQPDAASDLEWLRGDRAAVGTVHTVDGNPMRLSTTDLALRLDDAWRTEMPRRDRLAISALTAPLLLAYGYSRGRRG
jgi:hypothetical protein